MTMINETTNTAMSAIISNNIITGSVIPIASSVIGAYY